MDTVEQAPKGHGFGTFPVFLAAISTILGAVMFLRFGWAVGHVGIWGALAIVLVGHAITIPTALAISEIATNRKVEGGGEYYIISRSFGTNIGASIGIALFASQAISAAFYLIAFAQAFQGLYPAIKANFGITADPRMFSIPMALLLSWVVIKKGASIAVFLLYSVVIILAISLILFFMGGTWDLHAAKQTMSGIKGGYSWPFVFAVCFPAFTGMTAGVGLSGDLKNPRKSIPLGTLIATLTGALVYILIILKLGMNAKSGDLANNELIMGKIALWGPIIPIGLAAATLSSAIGSLLIAPRTLQALSTDGVFPSKSMNSWLSKGIGKENEPLNATWIVVAIAMAVIALGDVNVVAKIVSQFFMVTYGALCVISVLEHFAASPSYRPSFKSRWWISLIGAIGCVTMMIMMGVVAAILAVTVMFFIYLSVRHTTKGGRGVAIIFKGALYQTIRRLQVWLQKNRSQIKGVDWRPSFIAISDKTFERISAFNLLSWIAHRHGFGTYFHYINGMLGEESRKQANYDIERVIKLTNAAKAGIYSSTIVSPSFTTAVAQIIQVPGVSGMDNNGLILEFPKDDLNNDAELMKIQTGVKMALNAEFNVCILRSSEFNCGYKNSIHLWLTRQQLSNANLMILLAYIIMGHPDWEDSEVTVFAAMPQSELSEQKDFLEDLIQRGRIPISMSNVKVLPFPITESYEKLVTEKSSEADLVIVGFTPQQFNRWGKGVFTRFPQLRDVLFVRAEEDSISLIDLEGEVAVDEHELQPKSGKTEKPNESETKTSDSDGIPEDISEVETKIISDKTAKSKPSEKDKNEKKKKSEKKKDLDSIPKKDKQKKKE